MTGTPSPRVAAGAVLNVITGLEVGGAETLLQELCAVGHRRGAQPLIVSLLGEGPMRARFEEAGAEVVGLGMKRGVPSLSGLLRLARLIRARRPSVVQGWLYHGNLAAWLALRLSGLRDLTALSWGIYCSDMDLRAYSRLLSHTVGFGARISHGIDGIVYNSRAGMETHEQLGYASRAALIIENGIDMKRFRPDPSLRASVRTELGIPQSAFVCLAVGRCDPMKDWPTTIAAADAVEGLTLLIAGEGTEQFGSSPGRICPGRRDDLDRLYNAADCFVLASRFGEGASIALVEAMACGLPVVVTDVGDNGRLAGDAGLVVAPGDPLALEAALRRLVVDPGLRAAYGKFARERVVQRYSNERLYDDYESHWTKLSVEKPQAPSTRRPPRGALSGNEING